MASAVAHTLASSHFSRLCITEIPEPTAIRREVCFAEAVYDGEKTVEGITARLVQCASEIKVLWEDAIIPVVVDPEAKIKRELQADILIDGILAKRNVGTRISDAKLVIALGPGFYAGRDAHYVIETNRGHHLGRIVRSGESEKDTGIPGAIASVTEDRVLRAPADGVFRNTLRIGDPVQSGDIVGTVEGTAVESKISGVVRGLIRPDIPVKRGMKIGDVDPRGQRDYCYTISDKARTIAGSVLQTILMHFNRSGV